MGTFSKSVAVLFTFISVAQAETDENVIIAKRDERAIILEDSSEHNRMNKKFSLQGEFGFSVSPAISSGFGVGVFLNRNNLIQLDATEGSFPILFFSALKTKTISGSWKHFYGNSFYTKVGIAYRKIALYDRMDSSSSNTMTFGREYGLSEVLAADLSLGNQWQWANFTLGCDWIGLMVPVGTMRSTYDSTGISSEYDRRDLDNTWNRIAKITSAQLLRFYIGASF